MSRRGWIGSGGPAGLQNRVGGAQRDSGGFDSHTLPPLVLRRRRIRPGVLLLLGLAGAPAPLAGQDSLPAARPDSAEVAKATDTLTPPRIAALQADSARRPSPAGAMIRSLLVPGLGQLTLGRKLTAAVFVAFEGATLAMVIKSQRELNDARELSGGEETPLVVEKSRKREDWLVLMGINHVLSGLEAYVSAHLWDFPGEVEIRALPGGVVAGASVPVRFR